MRSAFTVLVIGNGPAALATAIELRRSARVEVRLTAARPAPAARHGDSLSPHGRTLLERLGAWCAAHPDEALPCHAIRSQWGGGPARHLDYLTHPLGPAWHVDRARLDARLRARAAQLGVRFDLDAGSLQVDDGSSRWRCCDTHGPIAAHAIVDATGRASWLARRLGAIRMKHDRQVACFAHGTATRAGVEAVGLVESGPAGWCYSAPAPSGRWTVACFTDADLLPRGPDGRPDWDRCIEPYAATRDRLEANGVRLADPAFAAADSACLDRLAGTAWLTVGDAAMSYDPLSAHGLTVALQSGIDAAHAIVAQREGDSAALDRYAHRLGAGFADYARERRHLYAAETRFSHLPYWHRRLTPAPASSPAAAPPFAPAGYGR